MWYKCGERCIFVVKYHSKLMKSEKQVSREVYLRNLATSVLTLLRSSINSNNAKIGKLELDITEEPADQLFKDRCRREIERLKERVEDTQKFFEHVKAFEIEGKPVKDKKPYMSLNRAIGFCILLMERDGYIQKDLPKAQLKAEVTKHFPTTSAHNIYVLLRANGLEDNETHKKCNLTLDHARKFSSDYEYGLTLLSRKTGH